MFGLKVGNGVDLWFVFLGTCCLHVPALISISGILSPVGVGVHLAGRNGEEAFVYVGHACGIGCDFPTGAVLELTEADKVVATPGFHDELAGTFVKKLVESGCTGHVRCRGTVAHFVHQRGGSGTQGSGTAAEYTFGLCQQNVGIAENGDVVELKTHPGLFVAFAYCIFEQASTFKAVVYIIFTTYVEKLDICPLKIIFLFTYIFLYIFLRILSIICTPVCIF